MFKLKTVASSILAAGLLSGALTTKADDTKILPKSSASYQLQRSDAKGGILQVQIRIDYKKPAGFKPHALYIKVNGTVLKPDRLVERKAQANIKGSKKLYTYVHGKGGISVPYKPSVEAFDKDKRYSLVSGKSVPLYKFKLDGLLKPGNNLIELQNSTKDKTFIVEFVKFNDKVLTTKMK